MDVENPMVVDSYWNKLDPKEIEEREEYLRRLEDEEYDGRFDRWQNS